MNCVFDEQDAVALMMVSPMDEPQPVCIWHLVTGLRVDIMMEISRIISEHEDNT